MLAERLLALAALAGRMVVVAAATDEWETARSGFAQLLGRRDPEQTRLTEQQLEETREQLIGAADPDAGLTRTTLARRWAGRLADLLEENPDAEATLRALVRVMQAVSRAEPPDASNHAVPAAGAGRADSAGEPVLEHLGEAKGDHPGTRHRPDPLGPIRSDVGNSATVGAVDDREVVAAIAAGKPVGVAMAYDKYAPALYGYCQWWLCHQTKAAEALRDTFVIAVAKLDGLPEAPQLRPWLYAAARDECRRRLGSSSAVRGREDDAADLLAGPEQQIVADQPIEATLQFRVVHQSGDATLPLPVVQSTDAPNQPTWVDGDPALVDMRTRVRDVLAELSPREREVIELDLRHDLDDDELAAALGVSRSRARALASRAWDRLEKALGVLLIMRTGREVCPQLDALLADWDGQLTDKTRELVGGHAEQCKICAGRWRPALRRAVLSSLLPTAVLPAALRGLVLRLCSDTSLDAKTYRRRVARRAESRWLARFSQAIRPMRWDSVRSNPGAATATAAAVAWALAAVSVILLTFLGAHSARALAGRPTVRTPVTTPTAAVAPVATPAITSVSASAKPSPTVSQPSAVVLPPAEQPVSPTPSAQPSPSPSPSAKPPKSASPKKSPSTKPSGSSSAEPSKSPTPSPSPSPSETQTS